MPVIASQLRRLRLQQQVTQEQLADAAGVVVTTVQNAEYGRSVAVSSVKRLANALGVSTETLLDVNAEDAIAQGPTGLVAYLSEWITPPTTAYLADEAECRTTAEQMVKQYLKDFYLAASEPEWIDFHDGYQAAEKHFDRTVQSFVDVWTVCSESFLFAVQGSERIGISVIMPLTNAAYEGLRNGKLGLQEIAAEHIQPGSPNILVNAIQELPRSVRQPRLKLTDAIFHLVLYQIAVLGNSAKSDSFRILSFAGTPQNRKRAVGNGFVPLKRQMAGIPFWLYEFPAANDERGDESNWVRHVFRGMANILSPAHFKRRTMKSVISGYQKCLRSFATAGERRVA